MTVSFNDIPNNIRKPGSYVEVDNTNATSGLATDAHVILLTGQMTSAGLATAEELIEVFSETQASVLFGAGSMLHLMAKAVFDNQKTMIVKAIPLEDAVGSAKATTVITLGGDPTENGSLYLYIAGEYFRIGVSKEDTITEIGDLIVDTVTKQTYLPVTATNAVGVVTLTAKNAGLIGNDMEVYLNWNGPDNNEYTPQGLTVSIVKNSDGATDPDIADAVSIMPDEIINNIVCPYNDLVSLQVIKDEMERRWDPMVQLEGHAYTGKKGTVSELLAIAQNHNDEHLTFLDCGQLNPTPAYVRLSAEVGVVAPKLEIDPARPLQTLEILGLVPDKKGTYRNFIEGNSLLNGGIATCVVNKAGQILVERLITTYQNSPAGAPDISYLDVNTLYTISFLRQTLINRIKLVFPRHKLASNGTRIPDGQAIATPEIIAGEIIALASLWGDLGLVENLDTFAEDLIVERNAIDPNRVDAVLPPDLINQFRAFCASIKFIL